LRQAAHAGCEKTLSAQLTELRVRYTAVESEINHLANTVDGATELVDGLEKSVTAKKAQMAQIDNALNTATVSSEDGDEDADLKAEIERRLVQAREQLSGMDRRKEELRDVMQSAEERRTAEMDEAQNLHQMYYKLQAQIEKLEADLNAAQERIWEEYGLNYSSCYEFKVEGFDVVFAAREIAELRRDISKLGPINLAAMEQSTESQERYESFTTQVTDLTAAKTDLEKVIADLSAEMLTKFRDTFNTINENFGVIFKELFGGGRARLELTDASDPLGCGIDIVAEPNGKKLQNIGLLSGGEKALTAIAILFAILKLRPMPFCLLDEIEAALDESNVVRFAKYLGNFSRNTQFIVITHRKPTMELADHLYGVTMEEKGVSKLVSVKLEAYA